LKYPTPDNIFWRGKYDTVQRLADTILAADLPQMSDDGVVNVLREIKGIGPQTASMVALFWLERAVPVVDTYLLRLLRHCDPWKVWLESRSGEEELRRNLVQWARKTERERPEWRANRSLASLYL